MLESFALQFEGSSSTPKTRFGRWAAKQHTGATARRIEWDFCPLLYFESLLGRRNTYHDDNKEHRDTYGYHPYVITPSHLQATCLDNLHSEHRISMDRFAVHHSRFQRRLGKESMTMGEVYGRSHLTIAARGARNA